MRPCDALSKAIEIAKTTQAALAKQIGVKPQTVNQWLSGARPIPPARAAALERALGGTVTRHDLCPEFPWEQVA